MAKITVVLEQLISESFEIDVPQELIDDKNGSKIIDIAIDMYNKKKTMPEKLFMLSQKTTSALIAGD